MIGRTNVGGGGVGNAFAYIGVTYPAGSTLTCTDGTRTLRAKDTTGLYVFPVPYAGTWTVTATDGTQTTSSNVSITTLWQDKTVTLTYQRSVVIFNEGDQCTSITGGWVKDTAGMLPGTYTNGGTSTIGSYYIEMQTPATNPGTCSVIRTNSKIDITGITKLTVYVGSGSLIAGTNLAVYAGEYTSGSTKAHYLGDANLSSGSFEKDINFTYRYNGDYYLFVSESNGTSEGFIEFSKLTLSA